ncbi:MAG: hypothetical protein Q4B54_01560, partial [Coriobacteriales bacterium]|nr:hypothetical protein [Coriobacteriales bacterium]
MLNKAQRDALVSRWPELVAQGVRDASDKPLFAGDCVQLPAGVCRSGGSEDLTRGTVLGFALDKRGAPSVVVHAPLHEGTSEGGWKTWIVNGESCQRMGENDAGIA